ncbi:MAG: TlpA family protein disulfide reductase [Phycisphaerales bacterium]
MQLSTILRCPPRTSAVTSMLFGAMLAAAPAWAGPTAALASGQATGQSTGQSNGQPTDQVTDQAADQASAAVAETTPLIAAPQIQVGQPFPELVFPTLDGRPMSLASLRGHRTMLHVFASW